MSTPNFRTQQDFDLYCYDEWDISQEQIDEMREINEYDSSISDDTIREWIAEDNVRFVDEDLPYALKECYQELNRELNFYEVGLKGGYYGGIQFYVKVNHDLYQYYGNSVDSIVEGIDNEDTRYYYDMCKSEFTRKIKSEVNFINKKLLPLLAKKMGFERFVCVGVFSNGEAVYERVA